MRATKEQKDTFIDLIDKLKCANMMQYNEDEIDEIIEQFKVFSAMIEVKKEE